MNGAQHSAKNTAKNVSLIALVLLLGLLCAANWLAGVNVAQMPADSPLRRAYDHLFGGAVGYEVRTSGLSAAEPAQVALTVDGQLCGVQYSLTELDAALSAVRPVWAEVLEDGSLEECGEQELIDALAAGDCAVLRYHGRLPLGLIAGWMGGKWDEERTVETLVYAAGAARLFVRTPEGALFSAPAQADSAQFTAAQRAFHGMPCAFAGGAYAVCPETLLFEGETLTLPVLKEDRTDLLTQQNGAGLEGLLSVFGLTAYTDFYTEQNGQARVFVDNVSTLRVHAAGLIQYASTREGSTVYAYEEGEVRGQDALDAQLDCARTILSEALRAGETDTHASLYAVQQEGGETTLVFLQLYGGVPVLGASDFATFRFAEDGALASATIRLQRFAPQAQTRIVLPARQAAAGAHEQERSMMVAYRAQEDGSYVPARFYLNTAS